MVIERAVRREYSIRRRRFGNFHPQNGLVRGHRMEVDLKKKKRLFVRR